MNASALAVQLPLLALVFVASPAIGGDSGTQTHPNIILIMADDIGHECFGCYGSQQYSTPRIDQMAKNGLRFTNCFSQPLCTPSRIKLMTGQSNVRNYSAFSVLNSDQKTIGQHFHDAGYETLIAGKWQLLGAEHYSKQFRMKGSWPRKTGFDHVCLWQVDRLGQRFWSPLLYVDGENQQFSQNDYGPDIACEFITDFIRKDHEKPFLIYYPMILVHNPFDPTPDSESRSSRNKQRNFEDMVAYMDKIVGRIIDATVDRDIEDETLIIFTGDNGTNRAITSEFRGGSIQGGKGLTNDRGTRVPLVALWPGTSPAGRVCHDLVDFSDFLPTALEAAAAPAPKETDGVSFLPQLHGQKGSPREWVHCYYNPRPERTEPRQFVRDKRWKLYANGEFFDVQSDVEEKKSLAAGSLTAQQKTAYNKLKNALDSFPDTGQMLLKYSESTESP